MAIDARRIIPFLRMVGRGRVLMMDVVPVAIVHDAKIRFSIKTCPNTPASKDDTTLALACSACGINRQTAQLSD